MRAFLFLFLSLVYCAAVARAESLVAEGADLEKLAEGFETVEGPLYDGEGMLYFTDIPNEQIWKLNVATLEKELFRTNTGGANGLAFDEEGMLLMCKGAAKCLSRLEKDGVERTLFEPVRVNAGGKEFPVGVNDVVVDRRGGIYVTVPGAGSVYVLEADGSKARPIVTGLKGPNGLMLSPDETKLYVSEYKLQRIHVYDLDATEGIASNGRVFTTVEGESEYGCDGMTVDNRGNLFCAGPHAVRVWNSEGKLIETIAVPESPTNCTFAGKGSATLYITGRQAVYRIRMKTSGVR